MTSMTVRQLMSLLAQCNPDAEVNYLGEDYYEVRSIQRNAPQWDASSNSGQPNPCLVLLRDYDSSMAVLMLQHGHDYIWPPEG